MSYSDSVSFLLFWNGKTIVFLLSDRGKNIKKKRLIHLFERRWCVSGTEGQREKERESLVNSLLNVEPDMGLDPLILKL